MNIDNLEINGFAFIITPAGFLMHLICNEKLSNKKTHEAEVSFSFSHCLRWPKNAVLKAIHGEEAHLGKITQAHNHSVHQPAENRWALRLCGRALIVEGYGCD